MPQWNCQTCGNSDEYKFNNQGILQGYCIDCYNDLLQSCNKQKEYRQLGFSYVEYDCIKKIKEIKVIAPTSEASERMTPQEQLFADLFANEKQVVKDMNQLELRAHREKLAEIAFEARARLYAVDEEDKDRKGKKSTGPSGFSRSVNTDEKTSDAINRVKDRQKRISKSDKIRNSLAALGISAADTDKIMSAGTILQRLKDKGVSSNEIGVKSEPLPEKVPVFNPFAKK